MAREIRVPITPSVLKWALGESGYDSGAFAGEVGVSRELVERWLDGSERPMLGQFRDAARVLRRPTATFLLPSPPKEKPPQVAFRHQPGEPDRDLHTNERLRIREVGRLQRIVGWLTEQIGETPASLPRFKTAHDPEVVGEGMRRLLDISVTAQLEWKGESEAVRSWRDAIERMGVLVFLLPMGSEAARGFSLFDDRAPALAANTHWNQAARIFTLLHELAHLFTRTNSICAEGVPPPSTAIDLERWCERVAAACLMPASAVETILRSLGDPGPTIATATKLARRFRVSLRAAALRLVSLGHAGWGLYTAIPPASDAKSGGGGGGGRKRPKIRIDEYGRRTASIVLRGLDREIISPSEAMSFLDVSYKNLEDLASLV